MKPSTALRKTSGLVAVIYNGLGSYTVRRPYDYCKPQGATTCGNSSGSYWAARNNAKLMRVYHACYFLGLSKEEARDVEAYAHTHQDQTALQILTNAIAKRPQP